MDVISYQVDDSQKVIIKVCGRLDFHLHREFRAAYERSEGAKQFLVDLRQASYLDSSALGMLLLLLDYAGGDKNAVSIAAQGDVLKVIKTANFQNLFDVLEAGDRQALTLP